MGKIGDFAKKLFGKKEEENEGKLATSDTPNVDMYMTQEGRPVIEYKSNSPKMRAERVEWKA